MSCCKEKVEAPSQPEKRVYVESAISCQSTCMMSRSQPQPVTLPPQVEKIQSFEIPGLNFVKKTDPPKSLQKFIFSYKPISTHSPPLFLLNSSFLI